VTISCGVYLVRSCTEALLFCFVICGCFDDCVSVLVIYVLVFTVLYSFCVFVLFCLCSSVV
jgi:hypothetical protein